MRLLRKRKGNKRLCGLPGILAYIRLFCASEPRSGRPERFYAPPAQRPYAWLYSFCYNVHEEGPFFVLFFHTEIITFPLKGGFPLLLFLENFPTE